MAKLLFLSSIFFKSCNFFVCTIASSKCLQHTKGAAEKKLATICNHHFTVSSFLLTVSFICLSLCQTLNRFRWPRQGHTHTTPLSRKKLDLPEKKRKNGMRSYIFWYQNHRLSFACVKGVRAVTRIYKSIERGQQKNVTLSYEHALAYKII